MKRTMEDLKNLTEDVVDETKYGRSSCLTGDRYVGYEEHGFLHVFNGKQIVHPIIDKYVHVYAEDLITVKYILRDPATTDGIPQYSNFKKVITKLKEFYGGEWRAIHESELKTFPANDGKISVTGNI